MGTASQIMVDRVSDELLQTMAARFWLVGRPTRLALLHALMVWDEKHTVQMVAKRFGSR